MNQIIEDPVVDVSADHDALATKTVPLHNPYWIGLLESALVIVVIIIVLYSI
jgi:hypothetical protein